MKVMYVYPEVASLSRDAIVRGSVRDWLIAERVPAQWMPRQRGWAVRLYRLPDVVARAERAGIVVRMRGAWTAPVAAPWTRHRPRAARPSARPSVGQLVLLDVGEAA